MAWTGKQDEQGGGIYIYIYIEVLYIEYIENIEDIRVGWLDTLLQARSCY